MIYTVSEGFSDNLRSELIEATELIEGFVSAKRRISIERRDEVLYAEVRYPSIIVFSEDLYEGQIRPMLEKSGIDSVHELAHILAHETGHIEYGRSEVMAENFARMVMRKRGIKRWYKPWYWMSSFTSTTF